MTVRVRFLVIGAGPTGLGAAARLEELGEDYLLVDKSDSVGGMAASITDKHGYTWDLGGHVVHSHFPEFDRAVEASGARMRDVHRNGWVWMDGDLVPTPVQQQLEQLPEDLTPDAPAPTLAHYYRNHFGSELYERFFHPYTFKMWATPLHELGHEWTSERSGSTDRNVPVLGLRGTSPVRAGSAAFPYPVGGSGALWEAIADALVDRSRMRLSTEVAGLDVPGRHAHLPNGETVSYEQCITTAPITTTARWAGLGHLADPLGASRVEAIGVGFTGHPPAALTDKTWLYSPDADVPWYRLTMLSNYDPGNAGPGRWSALCEVSSSPHREISRNQARQGTLRSLERLGSDLGQLESVWQRTLDYGYPLPTLGRDKALHHIDAALRADGVRSRGRFGGWRYESCNQDHSWMQGRQAVDSALSRAPETAYWHP